MLFLLQPFGLSLFVISAFAFEIIVCHLCGALFEFAVDNAQLYFVVGVVASSYETGACHRHVVSDFYECSRLTVGIVAGCNGNDDDFSPVLCLVGGFAGGHVFDERPDVVEYVAVCFLVECGDERCFEIGQFVFLEEGVYSFFGEQEQRLWNA